MDVRFVDPQFGYNFRHYPEGTPRHISAPSSLIRPFCAAREVFVQLGIIGQSLHAAKPPRRHAATPDTK
jgi:hypothetical protein